MNKNRTGCLKTPQKDTILKPLPRKKREFNHLEKGRENWECLIDFTKIKKGGVEINELLSKLRKIK